MTPDVSPLLSNAIAEATSGHDDDDAYWSAVRTLQLHDDPSAVFAAITPFAHDADPRLRALVPDVLRYLGGRSAPFGEAAVDVFRAMLITESMPAVLSSIGFALGEIAHPAAVELMLPHAAHDRAEVRRSVVSALATHASDRALDALVALSADADDDVRNWATFSLGSLIEPGQPGFVDTPALRDALAARLDDAHDEARAEAVLGLAMRRDPRALPAVRVAFETVPASCHYVEAAYYLALPELVPILEGCVRAHPVRLPVFDQGTRSIEEAIESCVTGPSTTAACTAR